MGQGQKEVQIELHTEIEDEGQKETVTESHQGNYYMKDGKAVLLYTDKQNEVGEIKNFITVQPDKMSVKRSGAVSMQQIFVEDRQTECAYQHPYGRFLMEINTKKLEVDLMADTDKYGKVRIEYDMLFQGSNRHYTLTMEFMEVQ